jgi:hypothetical protein
MKVKMFFLNILLYFWLPPIPTCLNHVGMEIWRFFLNFRRIMVIQISRSTFDFDMYILAIRGQPEKKKSFYISGYLLEP